MNIEQPKQPIPFTTLVLPLNAAQATLEHVGGKGASLARMARAGLPVPAGFHITTTAYGDFVTANTLQDTILAAAATATPDNPASLETASTHITQLFIQGTIPSEIADAIRQAYAHLEESNVAVAVRSSATAEDLPDMSFAGQQETYLNMRGETMVLDAVKRCWASLWTARAIGYRARHGIAPADVSLAVVIQKLVPADAAGILFTANPVTGTRDQVMINAAWGLGEAIVGGQVTPDSIVVDKTSGNIVTQDVSDKQIMTVRTAQGTHEEPVPTNQRTIAVLSASQAKELTRIGTQIEQLYGRPMDIEWAMHNGQFFIVQARPITALPDAPAQTVQTTITWNTPHPKGSYVRGSVIELLPDPLSPLFETLGLPAWNQEMISFMREGHLPSPSNDNWLVTINDYCYYNVTYTTAENIQMLMAVPRLIPAMDHFFRTARRRWEQTRFVYTRIVQRWEARELSTSTATELFNGTRELTATAAHYYLTIQSGILPVAYMSEAFFTLVYDKLFKQRNDPPALAFLLGYDSAPIQAEKSLYDLAQWARTQEGLATVLGTISGKQFNNAYQTMQLAGVDETLWKAFCQRFAEHLARFGHTISDLDFAKSMLVDDPASLLETLKFFLSGTAPDPYARQALSTAKREQAMWTLKSRLHGLRLSLFWRLLRLAQRFAPLREDALADVGLGWPILRCMLREIGQRLVTANAITSADDIFWLRADEVQAVASALDSRRAIENYQAKVSKRRATWEQERRVTPPASLPLKAAARFLGFDYRSFLPAHTDQQEGDVIKGIGASPGHVTGAASVISGPDEFGQMRPGDILVAKITTPAWTPLFALAAGVITDVGGPLSHSSIVAREYHIPAVLGTGVATDRLHSGQRVTVDGDAGTVTISET